MSLSAHILAFYPFYRNNQSISHSVEQVDRINTSRVGFQGHTRLTKSSTSELCNSECHRTPVFLHLASPSRVLANQVLSKLSAEGTHDPLMALQGHTLPGSRWDATRGLTRPKPRTRTASRTHFKLSVQEWRFHMFHKVRATLPRLQFGSHWASRSGNQGESPG